MMSRLFVTMKLGRDNFFWASLEILNMSWMGRRKLWMRKLQDATVNNMFPLAFNTAFGGNGHDEAKHRVMLKVILLSVADTLLDLGWRLGGALKEVALYLGTAAGPTLFLVAIICSNLYLLFVPVIATLIGQSETYDEAFKKARVSMAWVWSMQAEKFFGYSVKGFDKIPDKGGAVIVYYHGPIPVDYFFLVCQTLLRKGRLVRSIVDRVLINIP